MEIKKDILKKLKELKNSQCKKERVHSHALLLLNSGRGIKEVAEIFDVTECSIYNWIILPQEKQTTFSKSLF